MSSVKEDRSKKDRLLNIAGEIFFRQGYGSTGIKQIIEEAGIAKGTFYSHFSSKESVGIKWLQKNSEYWDRLLNEASEKARSPRANILLLFDMVEEWMKKTDYRGCAFLNTLAELPQPTGGMREVIRKHKESIRAYILNLTRAHFADKPKSFAEHKGMVIYLLFEGALVEGQNVRDLWPVDVARKEVKAILSMK